MTPLTLFLFVPPVVSLLLAPYAYRHRRNPGARSFVALALSVGIWGMCYALEIAAGSDLPAKLFWSAAKYVGIVATTLSWFVFATEYVGRGGWLSRRRLILLTVLPVTTVVLAFSNAAHHLMWGEATLVVNQDFVALNSPFGPWFWVHAAYSYLLLLGGAVLIVRMLVRQQHFFRRQALALLLAVVVPWIANALVIFSLSPIPHLDLTAPAFTLSVAALAWALFRFRLLDVTPVARDAVLENIHDAVIVLDAHSRIADVNPAAQRALGRTAAETIGQPAEQVFADWPQLVERYREAEETREQIEVRLAGEAAPRHYDLSVSPLRDRHGRPVGRLLVLHDITEGQLAEALRVSEERLSRRAAQLQSVAEVAHAIASLRQLDELLPLVTRVISERFDFYHVGVFLLDEAGEYVVLQAANSEGGQRMLDRQHQLRVGQVGIVGHATGSGEARIALDVGQDAVYFDNPDLPLTRSELALPLKVRGRVIGALDVQSTQEAAFAEEDVTSLGSLADQVAIAIENARAFERQAALVGDNRRLLKQSEEAVAELKSLTRRLTGEGWEQYLIGQTGRLVLEDVIPGADVERHELPELDQAVDRLDVVTSTDRGRSVIAYPIVLRGEVIGTLGLEDAQPDRAWSEADVELVKGVAEHVSLALDNARLFEQAQQRVSELVVIDRITRELSTQQGLDSLATFVVNQIRAVFNVTDAYLALYDSQSRMIEVAHMVEGDRKVAVEPFPLGTGLTSIIIQQRRPMLLNQDAQRRAVELGAKRVGATARSYLGVPIVVRDEVLGVIAIQDLQRDGRFGEAEERLLSTIAPSVGIAIQNARLFDQLQAALTETRRRVQRERLVNEVTAKIRAASTVEDVLHIAVDELRQATRTTHAVARLNAPASNRGNGHSRDGSPETAEE